MKEFWERCKRFCNGQERIDRLKRESEQSMKRHDEALCRAREQYQLAMALGEKEAQRERERAQQQTEQAAKQARAELRDRFAMAALTGLVGDYHDNAAAKLAYEYADAMLKARGDD